VAPRDYAEHMTSESPNEKPITVALVEDNSGIREGWRSRIGAMPDCRCVAACASAEEALQVLPALSPDVVLMDINLPGASGVACTAQLKQLLPKTQVLVVTVYSDTNVIFQALQAGASGYLLKHTSAPELRKAIRDIVRGCSPMSGQIARKLIESFHCANPVADDTAQLSAREREVLELLAQGYAYKEIASRLNLSAHTVDSHLRHIYDKLHVRSRGEAAAKYAASTPRFQAGLIPKRS
jgi:DNA-binding NarL/FixJ family response regulator